MTKRSLIKPMRSLRSELSSLLLVALFPVAVLSIFPFGAVMTPENMRNLRGSEAGNRFRFSFVDMRREDSERAIRQLCSSWRNDAAESNSRYHYMPLGDLPEEESGAIGARLSPGTTMSLPLPDYVQVIRLHSLAAPPPVKVERANPTEKSSKASSPFTRAELLEPGL